MSSGELDQYFSTSPDEEVIKAAPGSHNELNDDTLQGNIDNNDAELTEEQLLRYLDGDDNFEQEIDEECLDGTHPDFVRNLNDKLKPLAEGWGDPTEKNDKVNEKV